MSSPPVTEWDVEPVEPGASTGVERLEMLRSRLAATFDDAPAAAETVERFAAAAGTLHDVDPSGFDGVTMRTWLEGVEQARRTVEAAAVAAAGAGAVDRPNPFRGRGFFTAKSAVKHMCRLSGPTANILIDHESFEACLRGETPDPATYRSIVVRTQTGRRLHPDDAVNAALIGTSDASCTTPPAPSSTSDADHDCSAATPAKRSCCC